jgi:hypothetical protein
MDREGLASHALDGIAAIGSGADVAMSTMLVLGQNRGMTLEETLYSVASAKFAAERCEGVGRTTTMFVSWKRTESDPEKSRGGNFVHPPQVDEIKESVGQIWQAAHPAARVEFVFNDCYRAL